MIEFQAALRRKKHCLLAKMQTQSPRVLKQPQTMPEVCFTIQLPDGATKDCYSPSSIVRTYFTKGEEMPVTEFLTRSRKAFGEASERVRAKFGFYCSSASAQLADIERWTLEHPNNATIRIIHI